MQGGQLIREARRRAGMRQRDLAERLGVSQPVVARWERDRGSVTLANLTRILRACGYWLDVRLAPIDDGSAHDWSLVQANLRLTPEQRLERAASAANLVLAGRDAVRRARGRG
jgi:transcriptional regulator with XRE-family HTH domain